MNEQNDFDEFQFSELEEESQKKEWVTKFKENWPLYSLPFALLILAIITIFNISRAKPEILVWAEENIIQTELYIFESGEATPPNDIRIYSILFNQDQTRYINFNFRMIFNPADTQKDFTLKAVYIHPDNSVLWETEEEFILNEGDIKTSFTSGYGFDEPGNWSFGTYIIRIYFEDYFLTESYFKVEYPTGPPTPTPTPVPDNSGVVIVDTVTVFFGPGPEYGQIGTLEYGDLFDISGAYEGCEWIQVIFQDNEIGAIWSGYIEYTLECEELAQVDPPPVPTEYPSIEPPYVPPLDSIAVTIQNNTEENLYIELYGVINQPFIFPPGEHELLVPLGTYAFYGYSCGTSENGEFLLENGDEWIWVCD